ncbi:MAG: type III pantothenate kinase [Chitinophagaceae bacterium]
MVTICFDFGNTRLKYAVFNGSELEKVEVLEKGDAASIEWLLSAYKPERTILSSVIDHDPAIEEVLSKGSSFHKLSHLSVLPFTLEVGKPETMGADRAALAAAAQSTYQNRHCVVVGLGTAITYNYISKYGAFLGGGISPGMEMRFKSLKDYTAKLPLVKKDFNFPLIGYDTRTNILSGVIMGMIHEVDGMIDSYKEKFEDVAVVLTGGDSAFIARHLRNEVAVDEDFVFRGLLALSQMNAGG